MSILTRERYAHAIIAHSISKRTRYVSACTVFYETLTKSRFRRGPSIPLHIFCFSTYIQGLSDTFFTRLYCMDKPSFFKLADFLTVQRAASGLAFSKSSPLLRLPIILRWLAGGSYLDISLAHGVAPSSLYHHIDHTLSDIDRSLKIKFPYNDKVWLQETSTGFTREERSPLYGGCAALDGLAIKIVEPSRQELGNTSTYYNRKGFFAINLQGACDHKYRFVFASGLAAGSTHDSTAFAMSSLASLLSNRDNGLPTGYWISCDEAYAALDNLLTPWPRRNLPREKGLFQLLATLCENSYRTGVWAVGW